MKRSAPDSPSAMKASMIRINVGGQVFATTKDTLSKCGYFEPYLAGRIRHAEDDQGALFIDRSPDLFRHLLQYMRAGTAPSRSELRRIRQELLSESLYFIVPGLVDHIQGRISPHDMRPEDREVRALERHRCKLIDLYACALSPKEPIELQATLLPNSAPRARMKGDFREFKMRFNELTGGLSERLKDVDGLVFAGGSVTGAICDCGHGDVDIFLCCQPEKAREILERVYASVAAQHLQRFGAEGKILVTRSKHAVTLFQVAPDRPGPSPVQIVLSVYETVADLLGGFDVDRSVTPSLRHTIGRRIPKEF